jgi:hypothetical protein
MDVCPEDEPKRSLQVTTPDGQIEYLDRDIVCYYAGQYVEGLRGVLDTAASLTP